MGKNFSCQRFFLENPSNFYRELKWSEESGWNAVKAGKFKSGSRGRLKLYGVPPWRGAHSVGGVCAPDAHYQPARFYKDESGRMEKEGVAEKLASLRTP